jgi:hypothetical protein
MRSPHIYPSVRTATYDTSEHTAPDTKTRYLEDRTCNWTHRHWTHTERTQHQGPATAVSIIGDICNTQATSSAQLQQVSQLNLTFVLRVILLKLQPKFCKTEPLDRSTAPTKGTTHTQLPTPTIRKYRNSFSIHGRILDQQHSCKTRRSPPNDHSTQSTSRKTPKPRKNTNS